MQRTNKINITFIKYDSFPKKKFNFIAKNGC